MQKVRSTSDLLIAWDAARIVFDTSEGRARLCALCALALIVSKVRTANTQDILEDMLSDFIA